jgi:hypothetical protein
MRGGNFGNPSQGIVVPNRKPMRRYCRLYIMKSCFLPISALEDEPLAIDYSPVELRTQSEPLRQFNVMRATPIKVPCILLQLERTALATPPRALYAQQAAREWPQPTYCLLWILTCCTVRPLTSRADHTREQPCSSLTNGGCRCQTARLRTEQLQLFPCCPVVPVPPLILLVFTIFSVPSVHEEVSGPDLSARCSYTLHGSFIQAGGAHL